MPGTGLALIHLDKGRAVPEGYAGFVRTSQQAIAMIEDVPLRRKMQENIDAMARGDYSLLLLIDGERPAGVMCFDVKGNDAQVYFACAGEAYKACEGRFFEMAVRDIQARGMSAIRTNFLWPSPEGYVKAAESLGFRLIERINMTRGNDSGYTRTHVPEGVEILPWSESYLEAVARLLFEDANPVDREIYPQLQTCEGTLADLRSITGNNYGAFLPGQSMVALCDGKLIGMLLATEYDLDSILIADIAVKADYRGKGIASAMIGRLIRDSAALDRKSWTWWSTRRTTMPSGCTNVKGSGPGSLTGSTSSPACSSGM